jgi:hypothetical protein
MQKKEGSSAGARDDLSGARMMPATGAMSLLKIHWRPSAF